MSPDLPISVLQLSTRASRCLVNGGFKTVREVAEQTDAALLRIENMGRKSLNEIRQAIDSLSGETPMTDAKRIAELEARVLRLEAAMFRLESRNG